MKLVSFLVSVFSILYVVKSVETDDDSAEIHVQASQPTAPVNISAEVGDLYYFSRNVSIRFAMSDSNCFVV